MNGEIKRLIDTQSLNKEYFIFEKYSNNKEKKIIRMLSHPFLFIMMGIFVLISFTTISFLVVDFFSFIVIALFYRKRVIKKPPAVLYHGTAQRFLDSIRIHGLLPQKRQYVHLSQDVETAILVGKRRDEPRENKTIFNRGYLLSMVFIS